MARLRVEVVRATRGAQSIVPLSLEEGATVLDAVRASGLAYAEASGPTIGIFGHRVAPQTRLKDGDRVEIYRPLMVDPKESRRERAGARRRLKR